MLSRKFTIVIVIIFVLIGVGVFVVVNKKPKVVPVVEMEVSQVVDVIGKSVQGRVIESYTYGNGEKRLLFVGGMHGGYEWNSVLLAYELINYLKTNLGAIPVDIAVIIIPNLNPDGVEKSAVGRFNANGVDLNRNFDCKWQAEASWRSEKVSAGRNVFSEPEALALKNLVEKVKPKAVVFWHSQANAVYASECKNGILPVTLDIMNAYAKAGGYPAVKSFLAYPVTGDAEGWLASIGIPAITVELKTHEAIEWDKNLAGVKAILNYFK